jgi:hypothetical protein
MRGALITTALTGAHSATMLSEVLGFTMVPSSRMVVDSAEDISAEEEATAERSLSSS